MCPCQQVPQICHLLVYTGWDLQNIARNYAHGWWFASFCQSLVPLDLLHKSHNAPVIYPTIYHFVTEMCTCVYISVTKWCIVGYLFDALWDLWDGSIDSIHIHNDVIKWKHFLCYWPFLQEFTSPGEFPTQRPVTRSFDFSLICAWINNWVNNREAGDLRHHRGHYEVNVMPLWLLHCHSGLGSSIIVSMKPWEAVPKNLSNGPYELIIEAEQNETQLYPKHITLDVIHVLSIILPEGTTRTLNPK